MSADAQGIPFRAKADEETRGLGEEQAEIEQIAMHPKGTRLAAVDDEGGVYVLNLKSNTWTAAAEKHPGGASCVAWRSRFNALQDEFVTGGFDQRIVHHRIVPKEDEEDEDEDEEEEEEEEEEEKQRAPVVEPFPEDMLEEEGEEEEQERRRKLRGSREVLGVMGLAKRDDDLQGGAKATKRLPMVNVPFVYAVSVDHMGEQCVVGAGDGFMRVYSMFNGELVKAVQRHRKRVTCVAFPEWSPQYRCMTGSDDRQIILWNLMDPVYVRESPVLMAIQHGLKPNAILCRSVGTYQSAPHFAVADTSNSVSAYSFRE